MHPAAKRCVLWSVGLFVLGTLSTVYLSDLYLAVTRLAGANADAGLAVLDLAFTLVRMAVFPVAAVLVGAAVVIQTLAGHGRRPPGDRGYDPNRTV